jgi:phosphoribosylformimino-5-aminoimidazole carboxamide ribotide isomerase
MTTATRFEVLPAIDLRGGRAVRLVQGDFERETVFATDPLVAAEAFVAADARWLHVVDLDGARGGRPMQTKAIAAIVRELGSRVAVEVAGGVREEAAAAQWLEIGAARVVIGTKALEDPDFARRLVARFGADKVACALDIREGLAVGHGWTPGGPGSDPVVVVSNLLEAGVETFEVTAIERDGTLAGPDLGLLGTMTAIGGGTIIASGGIGSIQDLRDVRSVGCGGAIVGRALYDGTLALVDVLAAI